MLKLDTNNRSSEILSGLKPNSGSDSEAVEVLLHDELHVDVNVVSTLRLGVPLPNKVQILRATMGNNDEAADVISRAKLLRRSVDHYISNHVYINRDLTKAELQMAYENRCHKRTSAATSGNGNQGPVFTRSSAFNVPGTNSKTDSSSHDSTTSNSGTNIALALHDHFGHSSTLSCASAEQNGRVLSGEHNSAVASQSNSNSTASLSQ